MIMTPHRNNCRTLRNSYTPSSTALVLQLRHSQPTAYGNSSIREQVRLPRRQVASPKNANSRECLPRSRCSSLRCEPSKPPASSLGFAPQLSHICSTTYPQPARLVMGSPHGAEAAPDCHHHYHQTDFSVHPQIPRPTSNRPLRMRQSTAPPTHDSQHAVNDTLRNSSWSSALTSGTPQFGSKDLNPSELH